MGDNWTASALVTVDRHRAVVEAYSGDMLPSVVKDISRALKRRVPEVTELVYVRINDGVERDGVIKMSNDKTYRVEQGPIRVVEVGPEGFERVNWEGVANTWVGSYEVVVTVQEEFEKYLLAMRQQGAKRAKKG